MRTINLRKFFLYLLIASVAVSALIGIVVIIFGNFGELESKILLTTLTVTVTSVLGLACGACLETKRARVLPLAGIFFAVLMGILWVVTIWAGTVGRDYVAKIILSVNALAGAFAHLSLVTIARLDKRFLWSRYVLHITVWSIVSIFLVLVWTNFEHASELTSRVLGVLGIATAALTIVTPVFHKLSSPDDDAAALDAEIETLRAKLAELEARRAKLNDVPETVSDEN